MDKSFKKEKAMELFREGLSYGKIAIQLDEPKTTVHRWINSLERSEGTNDNYNRNETNTKPKFHQIPKELTKRLVSLLSEYISFDNQRITGEMLIDFECKLENIKSEIKTYARNNNIFPCTIKEIRMIKGFLNEILDQYQIFYGEELEYYTLLLDWKWKKKYKKWIKQNKKFLL